MKPFEPGDPAARRSRVFIDLWQKTVELRQRDALIAEQELARARARERGSATAPSPTPSPRSSGRPASDGVANFFNARWYEYFGADSGGGRDVGRASSTPTTGARSSLAGRASAPWSEPFEAEYRIRRADGAYRWHLGRSVPHARTRRRTVTGWVGTATDIEDRKLAEERQRFLVEAGWVLGSSLDYEQTLADVARLAVPRVADWCAVDIFVDGALERLALEHADPLKVALARELQEAMLRGPLDPRGDDTPLRRSRCS